MFRLLIRLRNWLADRSIEDNGLGYCEVLEDGFECGRPGTAEGITEDGDVVVACPMHDSVLIG